MCVCVLPGPHYYSTTALPFLSSVCECPFFVVVHLGKFPVVQKKRRKRFSKGSPFFEGLFCCVALPREACALITQQLIGAHTHKHTNTQSVRQREKLGEREAIVCCYRPPIPGLFDLLLFCPLVFGFWISTERAVKKIEPPHLHVSPVRLLRIVSCAQSCPGH